MQRFLVVEGLIGVGKTSLTRLLESERGAQLVLEPADTNPFLQPYYADPARYAFPVQMFYLVNRWRQQQHIRQGDLFRELVVSDYLFAKDRLFAEKTLGPDELALYERFASVLDDHAPTPDLVVYLETSTGVLLRRIAERKSPGEHRITAEYLDDLRARYERLLGSWTACPVLRVDNTAMDYVRSAAARRSILDMVDRALAGQTQQTPGSASDREVQPSLFGAG